MKALVVGGAGFLGSHLTERLVAEGHSVDVVDILSTGSLGNLAAARRLSGDLRIHTLDATSPEFASLMAMREPEVVYHLGLLPPGEPAEDTLQASLSSLAAVLEGARRGLPAKVVVALGAAAVYGEVPAKEQPVKESRIGAHASVAAAATRSLLDLLGVYRERHGVEFTALVIGSAYGPRQRREAGVVAAFAAALRDGVTPMLEGDGRQTRDFVYVDDVVDALARASTRAGGLLVNIGTGTATSIRDVWSAMAGPDGRPPAPAPRRPDDIARMSLAVTRARIHLAWAPWTALADGLRATVATTTE